MSYPRIDWKLYADQTCDLCNGDGEVPHMEATERALVTRALCACIRTVDMLVALGAERAKALGVVRP